MAPELDCISPALLMEGYLRKSKKWSKRYFVLREGPPPCLEYFDSAKRKTGRPKRVIDLRNAWNIDKKVSTKHKYLIGIYTETEYFAMGAETEPDQEMWVNALQKAVLGSKGHVNRSHLMYRHIWQGNVDTKDLDNCNNTTRINLQGPHRCCLTDKTMVFVRLNNSGSCNLQAHNHVEITIGSIRSCGHKDNMFFMEPGRSSGIGTGKLWMELEDSTIADNMHKTILALWNLGQDDSRQRSYSFGSSTSRPSNNRSRHYYNPPPSQVGLGKPTTHTTVPKLVPSNAVSRNRCESFPATQASNLTEESRYRTSSEGETTMKRHYPLHSLTFRRKPGSVSPNTRARVYSQGKRPLYLQPSSILHYRTSSLPGSYTSSSNSSIEHINTAHDFSQNGQSPATSESQGSSDEFSVSQLNDILLQSQLRHSLLNYGGMEMAPPPPSIPPETVLTAGSTPTSTVQESEYSTMQPSHSRSHSMDDNLSCDTGASSLSSSPQVARDMPGVSPSPDASFLYSQSPSQNSSHSHFGDVGHMFTPTSASPDEYALMSPTGSEAYPQSSNSSEQPSSDYTIMTPGRVVASSTPSEDKSGYVPMRPLVRSQPQDIVSSRRRSLSDNRLVNGSYSPVSPLSRSPDKAIHVSRSLAAATCAKCKRQFPNSYPCHCGTVTVTVTKGPTIPAVSLHGLKVDPKNDFSFDRSSQQSKPPVNNSEDYESMNGIARTLASAQLRPSPSEISKDSKDGKEFPPSEPEIDHEYLPMSPMNAANSKKLVVGNVLLIAASASKPTKPSSSTMTSPPKYPHQQNISVPLQYSTNSLDRSTKQPRKRTKSLGINTLLSGQRHTSSRPSKHGRKYSLRVNTDASKSTPPPSSDQSSKSSPPLSPGGEYVSIDFDKAKKQVGPGYVSLTDPSQELGSPVDCNQRPDTPKVTHDSNRNILPARQSPPKDDYTLLKPGAERGFP